MPSSEHRAWPPAHSGLWKVLEAEGNWTLWSNVLCPGEMRPEEVPASEETRVLPPLTGTKMPGDSIPLVVPYLIHEGRSPLQLPHQASLLQVTCLEPEITA